MICFVKAETNGNDFVILKNVCPSSTDIKRIADRKKGIGADQIIVINEDYVISIWNSDGSKADMCGNGLCAVNKYLFAGQDLIYRVGNSECRGYVETDTGLSCIVCPMPKYISDGVVEVGNKHIVRIGKDDELPAGCFDEYNVHFVEKLGSGDLKILESHERGAGITAACGSGAIAVSFAYGTIPGVNHVIHDGGESFVEFTAERTAILKTFPSIVFYGEITPMSKF